ncbi:unnamed protein product [Paramecium octaurelia]|uniref:Uncharacterized protein n=1 Tax=Paramecium octaurelia TaxID=43137 RepID=A0A8S1Y3A5_PAROT|nr:unnamed protein product [Paramecium octaurelia]
MLQEAFSYELQSRLSYDSQLCLAIAINHNNQQVIASEYTFIKLFQFKDGVLRLLKTVKNSGDIVTLNYFKKRSHFISGSYDSQLTIWSTNIQTSKYLVKLSGCSDNINCLVIHPSEDLIICGSNCIQFWSQDSEFAQHQQWVQFQNIENQIDRCFGLSINQNGNELVSCGSSNQILVMRGSTKQLWKIIQAISVENLGFRLTYISDRVFSFQPEKSNCLEIYSFNSLLGQYVKYNDIQVKLSEDYCYEFFPSVYIPSKKIILSKNGRSIHIIKVFTQSEQQDVMQFKLQQSICFGTSSIFGTMSDNGEYLITWEYDIGQIQIRKYLAA